MQHRDLQRHLRHSRARRGHDRRHGPHRRSHQGAPGSADSAVIALRRVLIKGARDLEDGEPPYAPCHAEVYRRRAWSAVLPRNDDFLNDPARHGDAHQPGAVSWPRRTSWTLRSRRRGAAELPLRHPSAAAPGTRGARGSTHLPQRSRRIGGLLRQAEIQIRRLRPARHQSGRRAAGDRRGLGPALPAGVHQAQAGLQLSVGSIGSRYTRAGPSKKDFCGVDLTQLGWLVNSAVPSTSTTKLFVSIRQVAQQRARPSACWMTSSTPAPGISPTSGCGIDSSVAPRCNTPPSTIKLRISSCSSARDLYASAHRGH